MKNYFRLVIIASILVLSSCGHKKKCNTCPDWGKVNSDTHQLEEA